MILHSQKLKGLGWLAVSCLLGLAIAFGVEPLAHLVPWQWEAKVGRMLESDRNYCAPSPAQQKTLDMLVARLYPLQPDDKSFEITVTIVKNKDVNAYALPGGIIHINDGLLKQTRSPEEVAAVLAHEIEHVRNRHIMQGLIKQLLTSQGLLFVLTGDTSGLTHWGSYFLNMGFTHAQEAEADRKALERLRQARIDNKGFSDFFERLNAGALAAMLSDHPASTDRARLAADYRDYIPTPILADNEWQVLKSFCNK